ncbi:oligopeptide transporter 1-like [Iris pallida]|uniref:Oligopeptide transporter 1-like n=1 Tax=Iris pallida TaxID=29817 RepID=A0AAX6G965_IRIPA|nr:oligopeptide transporter 1-like [Iris pallida]
MADNDSPIEQVRLTVPTTDDPTLPCLTFRTLVLGVAACTILSFLNQFMVYRQNVLFITTVSAQIAAMPLGKLMAAWLPSAPVRVPGTGGWRFSLNPGPFNLKEHVLITIFATTGYNGASTGLITVSKAFYHRQVNPVVAVLLTLTTTFLGYGWAGIFRKFLVDSPYMWWPSNLVQVSLFRALHDREKRPKGGLTRLQFFLTVFISSFAYYIVPNYLFPSISAISAVCLIWRRSVTMQQIGSGVHGLGVGSFGLDWLTVSGFLGSPLATPGFAIANVMAGFLLVLYVAVPVSYWTNTYEAKRFPLYSSQVFARNGSLYDVGRVLHRETLTFDEDGYGAAGQINLSILFVLSYGLGFATVASALSHVALFHGRTMWRQTKEAFRDQSGDIHTRMMKKYEEVPQWWFHTILVSMLALSIFTCEGFGGQLQLPYWGVILAAGTAFLFTLPVGLIYATTNQYLGLDNISELTIGYAYPGKPISNMAFRTYGNGSMYQAISFLQDFKLGHYMKIPPKSMFLVQLVGTTIASSVTLGTAWWLLESVENICDREKLPEGSPWTCPYHEVYYSSSVIWGVVGPKRIFGSLGLYEKMNYFFLLGLLAPVPVWALSKAFPDKKWIRLINVPVIVSATGAMPPARAVNYIMWFAVGIFFNFLVYRRFKGWWARNNYAMSAGLDAGVGFMTILAYISLQMWNENGIEWWGLELDDHCPLATCPTFPGIKGDNCPINV